MVLGRVELTSPRWGSVKNCVVHSGDFFCQKNCLLYWNFIFYVSFVSQACLRYKWTFHSEPRMTQSSTSTCICGSTKQFRTLNQWQAKRWRQAVPRNCMSRHPQSQTIIQEDCELGGGQISAAAWSWIIFSKCNNSKMMGTDLMIQNEWSHWDPLYFYKSWTLFGIFIHHHHHHLNLTTHIVDLLFILTAGLSIRQPSMFLVHCAVDCQELFCFILLTFFEHLHNWIICAVSFLPFASFFQHFFCIGCSIWDWTFPP